MDSTRVFVLKTFLDYFETKRATSMFPVFKKTGIRRHLKICLSLYNISIYNYKTVTALFFETIHILYRFQ